jgi:glycosyltransferase involved in cell wall biosynthesis
MKRKILIFSTAYFPFLGGAEVAVKEITDRLTDFHFDMLTARLDKKLAKKERIGNINVFRIGIGLPKFDKYLLALLGHKLAQKLDKENNYDAIWAIMASFGGFAAMFFKKGNPDRPFLLTLQEGDDMQYIKNRVGIFWDWFKQIFNKADHIQCISNFLANWAKELGAKCPIEVVPNGVDLKKFKIENTKSKVNELKQQIGIRDGEKIIITVSRLVPKNGIEYLIEAINQLSIINYQFPIKLLILGSGPLEKKLKLQVKNYKLENKVLFLGSIPNEKVPIYLTLGDVFVRPSLSEGLGNAFLEAMAAGVPIIGTPVGGIPDFLKDGETGLFCEVGNPKSIAEKINLLLSDENLKQRLIVNGEKLVDENYSWDIIAKKMKGIFEKICAS